MDPNTFGGLAGKFMRAPDPLAAMGHTSTERRRMGRRKWEGRGLKEWREREGSEMGGAYF